MKTVLVTGGALRLGKAIAEHLRASGWRVLTSSHRAESGADFCVDFSRTGAAEDLFEALCARLSGEPPDALVNNAALFVGDAKEIHAVNLEAPCALMRQMARAHAARATQGVVVNVLDARERTGAYGETKRRLREETIRAACECAPHLRVNGVAPGPVLSPTAVREKGGEMLIARPATNDVAQAVDFLLNASSTTGCVIPVDGGQHLL